MKLSLLLLVLGIVICSCKEQGVADSSTVTPAKPDMQFDRVPVSFTDALDILDDRYSEKEKADFLKGEGDFTYVHRVFGMQLRNEWGLWKGSPLKDYFSERGIAHADWITSAIFDGWRERITTGTFDEEALVAKYAAVEKRWRAEQAESESVPDCDDPFSSGK